MKSIRRLYFYLVAFISVEVVVWGLVGLLRSIVDSSISGGIDTLAQALALILVGVPIFLIHWLWAQRASARDEEEKTASIRALFFYAILFGTLVPVVQNLLSFIDRSLVEVTGLGVTRAFSSFRNQTLADNAIAIIMNGVVAAYFWNILRGEWATLTDRENFSDVRRLYRYLWTLYGLLMVVLGGQQILRFLFYIPNDILGDAGREVVVNGTALLVIGTPVWVYMWRVIQDSLPDPAEMGSTLRLVILYILALGGVITVITTSAMAVNIILTNVLGGGTNFRDFVREIGNPISVGVPFGMIWAYYRYWLNRHIEAVAEKVRQAAMKRLYNYILSAIGLVVAFVGVTLLFSFIIDMGTYYSVSLSDSLRSSLANSLSSLIVGLPLWLIMWRPMQTETMGQDELGDHARRSVIRRFYLYLMLFASVIGGMASAVGLVYQLIKVVLTGESDSIFINNILNTTQLLFLFGVVLIYHLRVLRADGVSTADKLTEKQGEFSVLIVDSGNGFVDSVKAALMKNESKVQVTVTTPDEKPEGDFSAIILSGSLAVNAPEWIRSMDGSRIIVQNEAGGLVWVEDAGQAALSVQMMAEGQEVQKKKSNRSTWMIVVYIAAALFGLELLFFLLAIGISLVAR